MFLLFGLILEYLYKGKVATVERNLKRQHSVGDQNLLNRQRTQEKYDEEQVATIFAGRDGIGTERMRSTRGYDRL